MTLKVYDVLGAKVATLIDDRLAAGEYRYRWDAGSLASGLYFCCLEGGSFERTIKMLLVR